MGRGGGRPSLEIRNKHTLDGVAWMARPRQRGVERRGGKVSLVGLGEVEGG